MSLYWKRYTLTTKFKMCKLTLKFRIIEALTKNISSVIFVCDYPSYDKKKFEIIS